MTFMKFLVSSLDIKLKLWSTFFYLVFFLSNNAMFIFILLVSFLLNISFFKEFWRLLASISFFKELWRLLANSSFFLVMEFLRLLAIMSLFIWDFIDEFSEDRTDDRLMLLIFKVGSSISGDTAPLAENCLDSSNKGSILDFWRGDYFSYPCDFGSEDPVGV